MPYHAVPFLSFSTGLISSLRVVYFFSQRMETKSQMRQYRTSSIFVGLKTNVVTTQYTGSGGALEWPKWHRD